MKIRILITLAGMITSVVAAAQPQPVQRVILIGDAGEINYEQTTVIPDAAAKILPGITSVFYLGDNVYPRGMGLPGTKTEAGGQAILRSQFGPLRAKGAPVYFLPGNHDWDRMGKQGLAKIKAQGDFITAQNDPQLKMIPANGCPDPVEISLGDQAVVIAYDSEWWLFPYNKDNADAACDCDTETEVLEKLAGLFWKNRNKLILLASHHPFRSYGVHGGKYNWKDHLFPLTAVNKNMWIPLPGLGSLYPLLRKSVFLNVEDLGHPQYQHLVQRVEAIAEGFPNIIKVAGHEHGLQLIDDRGLQVVSGAGAKSTYAKKGRHALFADERQGFVVVDIFADKAASIQFNVYSKDGAVREAYKHTAGYTAWDNNLPSESSELQGDSVTVAAKAKYDEVGRLHRKIFGENYRKEWAAPTRLPVLHLSRLQGGLKPLQRGGGMQTVSLRLADSSGKEWVLRSVNKVPDAVLPEGLRSTFATDLVDDYVSGQHPYSALIIPPLANAIKVPHASPVIGVVAPDPNLGMYNQLMAGSVALLEEREPGGNSDNSEKFVKALLKDNDNTFKAKTFFRAMLLDLLVSDWDRHEDQWRWLNTSGNKDKDYAPVPRDRDQVLKINTGIVPKMITRSWLMPTFQGFDSIIPSVKYSLYKHRFVHAFPAFQFTKDEWKEMTADFVNKMTDSVIDAAIAQLPASSRAIRGAALAATMKKRREQLPVAMGRYYNFYNQVVDLRLSDKNEQVLLKDAPGGGLHLTVRKINKDGEVKGKLVDRVYDPHITSEIRLYTGAGNDTIQVDYTNSRIKLRMIGGKGDKHIAVMQPGPAVRFYNQSGGVTYSGNESRIRKKISDDSLQTAFVPVNLYSKTMPLITGGFNRDDGFILGGGFRHIQQKGFRKLPYSSSQQLLISGAFATGAYQVRLKADWIDVLGKADIELNASSYAPHNTHNFFGLGNNTVYDKSHSISYYRSRYTLTQVDPLLRWRLDKNVTLRLGPSFQYFSMEADDNEGRFIVTQPLLSYDSSTSTRTKSFAGALFSFEKDSRNNTMFPTKGGYFSLHVKGYTGLNRYSRSLVQALPVIAVYMPLNNQSSIILANRTGGGVTLGHATFYQSLFLGGHDNLRGFRNYRFAGEQMLYNNLELRMRLAQIGSYILPGQLGATLFYDAGKVWAKGADSGEIHQGVGGGIYFAPANIAVFQLLAGYSKEGWNPHFTMGFRF
ncbi:BamA/TamA family outer membrane protein [Niabella sp. CJ426]|uniref:BamA/TamA family outer membrane protein n=1 Tax=Niabella sp. CJ426 TaxID=3393740 RepID=UPI003D023D25